MRAFYKNMPNSNPILDRPSQKNPTESQTLQMKALSAKHVKESHEQQTTFAKELQDLQNVFRRQNAAAAYAGLPRGLTVPNPVKTISIGGPSCAGNGAMQHNVSTTSVSTVLRSQNQGPMLSYSNAHPQLGLDDPHNTNAAEGHSTVTAITNTTLDPPSFKLALHASLSKFWSKQLVQMQKLPIGTEQDFKNHNDLPLARIKRIMKSDEDVRMISAEAPVLFAKACELFILELTLRSWAYSEGNKRRTLQKEDIQTAIRRTDIFDFLVDVIH